MTDDGAVVGFVGVGREGAPDPDATPPDCVEEEPELFPRGRDVGGGARTMGGGGLGDPVGVAISVPGGGGGASYESTVM